MIATEKQIALAYNQHLTDKIQPLITVDEFEKYKPMLSSDDLLIAEQLRLIAFTALDIQVLLQQVDFNHKTEQ